MLGCSDLKIWCNLFRILWNSSVTKLVILDTDTNMDTNMDTNSEFQESVSHLYSENKNTKRNTAVFECNICFDLAQDPVVTLCGHLFCWPCVYKWLQFHSHSHECPVCKSLIKDDNLIPIYGRGPSGSAPRENIPSRPASHRPQTAPPRVLTYFRQNGFGAPGRFGPMATTLFGAIASVLNFRVVDLNEMSGYGAFRGGNYMSYAHGGYGHGFHQYPIPSVGDKLVFLVTCFLFLGFLVVLMVISYSWIWF